MLVLCNWFISRFVEQHNHAMSDNRGEARQWKSHNHIDPAAKEFIRNARAKDVSLGRPYGVLDSTCGRSTGAPFSRAALRRFYTRISQETVTDDITKTMALLQRMQHEDANFSLSVMTDHDNRISGMLWCSGKNRMGYAVFGDVVTFDNTYKTNLYNMHFGLFVGVNNHFQSTVFGAVLLTTETIDNFI
jgi:hypothetical protein